MAGENNLFISGGGGFIGGVVDKKADLPSPASAYVGQFYLVQTGSGGILAIAGRYKYPPGLYTPNSGATDWEQAPFSVKVSEDSVTLANIDNWAEYIAIAFDINIDDQLIYNGGTYKNLTGTQTSTAPDVDTTNWEAFTVSAAEVTLLDTDGYYNSGNVEGALQETGEVRFTNGFDLIDKDSIGDLSWVDGTRTFSIAVKAGQPSFHFWADKKKISKTTTQSVIIPNTTGSYYIYFDNAGVLQYVLASSLSLDQFYENALIGIVYWNAVTGEGIPGDEQHGIRMDSRTHHSKHSTIGALYEAGYTPTGFSSGGTTYTNTDAGNFWDEDIKHTSSLQTTSKFLYRSGAAGIWTMTTATNDVSHIEVADTYHSWNEWTGSTWQLTEGTPSTDYWINFFITIPTLSGDTVYKIIGQNAYSTRANARNAIESELNRLDLGGLVSPEYVFLYAIIVNRSGQQQTLAGGSDLYIDYRYTRGKGGETGSTTDLSAVHVDVPGEINSITAKTTLVPGDKLIIEDTADSDNKKEIDVDLLVIEDGVSGGQTIIGGTLTNEDLLLKANAVDPLRLLLDSSASAAFLYGGLDVSGVTVIRADFIVDRGAGLDSFSHVNAPDGFQSGMILQKDGITKWKWECDNTVQGVGDTGNDFLLSAFNNAGGYLNSPIGIGRAAEAPINFFRPIKPFVRTTAQRDTLVSPAAGDFLFNSAMGKLNYYDGTYWRVIDNSQKWINWIRADEMDFPSTSGWPVTVGAAVGTDSNHNYIKSAQFSDSVNQALGQRIHIPAYATYIVPMTRSRAETAAASNLGVVQEFHYSQEPDNVAVTSFASTTLNTIVMGTSNEYWQYDAQSILLSTLSLVAGRDMTYMIERDQASGSPDTLVGPWTVIDFGMGFI